MNRKFIKNSNQILQKILKEEDCIDIIKNFVEAFLNVEIQSIKLNKCTNASQNNPHQYGIVDMRLKTNEEELNVGIQIIDGNYIQNKMFLYYAKIHSNQIFYNDKRKIARTITINILDMKFFSSSNYHRVIKIKSNIINDCIIETMELHVLELPKVSTGSNKAISNKESWALYLKGENEEDINKAKKYNDKIAKLDDLLESYWEEEII